MMADQIIDIGNNKRIVYRGGKSYLQVMAGTRVVSETQITSSQAQQQIEQSRPSSSQAPSGLPSTAGLTTAQLERFVDQLENVKANERGQFIFGGKTYTKAGWNNFVKGYKDQLRNMEAQRDASAEGGAYVFSAPGQAQLTRDAEILRVDELGRSVFRFVESLKKEADKTTSVAEQNNLRDWIRFYESEMKRLETYANSLSAGGAIRTIQDVNLISLDEAKRSRSGGGFAQPGVAYGGVPGAGQAMPSGTSTPFTPQPGQSVFGGQPIQPGTMVPGGSTTTVDLSGVVFPETPTETGTSAVVGDADMGGGMVAPPAGAVAGPSFTEPATGTTYQPGDQIGGEDRTLPNGGAVVDGIYIPPGIDYTWLGQQVPPDWEDAAKELYGAYYEMIKQYPELGTLLKNAIQQGWSGDKFDAELRQTNWWRTTSANTREWETLLIQDPASAQTQLDNRSALIRDTAQRLGITLSSESLARIAEDSIKLGLDLTSQLEDIVGAEALKSTNTVSQLRYGYVGNSIRESARKYGVGLSDITFNEWVNKIAVGAESIETFESYANQIARNLYPTLASGFDRGLSFGQMTDPYAQVASRILEIPTAQVDFTDPKWAQAFTMKNEKGEQVPMTFGEWSDYLRTNPSFGYEYTDDAVNKAYTVVNQLAELFGRA
jgi:hypothetical protein